MEARRSREENATCWLIARGLGAKGESPRGQLGGPGGDQAPARWCQGAVSAPFTPVAGHWLQGPRERQRLGTEKVMGWSVELVERPRKPAPEGVLMSWAEQLAKEGKIVDWQELLPPRGLQVLPRRWVVERSFA